MTKSNDISNDENNFVVVKNMTTPLSPSSAPPSKPVMEDNATDATMTATTISTVVSEEENDGEGAEKEGKAKKKSKKQKKILKEGAVADDSFLTIEEATSEEEEEEGSNVDKEASMTKQREILEDTVQDDEVEDPRDEEEESDASDEVKERHMEADKEDSEVRADDHVHLTDDSDTDGEDIDENSDEDVAASKKSATLCNYNQENESQGEDKDEGISTASSEEDEEEEGCEINDDSEILPSLSPHCKLSSPSPQAPQNQPLVLSPFSSSSSSSSYTSSSDEENEEKKEESIQESSLLDAKPFDEVSLPSFAKHQQQEQNQQGQRQEEQQEHLPQALIQVNQSPIAVTSPSMDKDEKEKEKVEKSERCAPLQDVSNVVQNIKEDNIPTVITITANKAVADRMDMEEYQEQKKESAQHEENQVQGEYLQQQQQQQEKKQGQVERPSSHTAANLKTDYRSMMNITTPSEQQQQQQQQQRKTPIIHTTSSRDQGIAEPANTIPLQQEEQQQTTPTHREEHIELTQVLPSQILSRRRKKVKAARASTEPHLQQKQEQIEKKSGKRKARKSRKASSKNCESQPPPLAMVEIPSVKDETMDGKAHNCNIVDSNENNNKDSTHEKEVHINTEDADDEDIPWDERQLEQKHTANVHAYQFLLDAFRTTTDVRVVKRISHVSDQTLLKFLKWKPDAKRSYRRMRAFMKFRERNLHYFDTPDKPLLVSRDMELYRLLEYDIFAFTSPPPTTSSTAAMIHSNSCNASGATVGNAAPPVLLTRLGNLPSDNEDPLNISRATLYLIDRMLERSDVQDHGLIVLHDMTNVTLRTVRILSDLLYDTHGCFPLKVLKMYFYNCPWYMSSTGAITRHLSEKLFDRTKFVKGLGDLKEELMNDWATVGAGNNIFQKRENKKLWRLIDRKERSGDKAQNNKNGSWVSMQYGREVVGDDFTSLSDCVSRRMKPSTPKPSSPRRSNVSRKKGRGPKYHSVAPGVKGHDHTEE